MSHLMTMERGGDKFYLSHPISNENVKLNLIIVSGGFKYHPSPQ